MSNDPDKADKRDKREARTLALALIALVLLLGIAAALLLPSLMEAVTVHISPGLGLRDAAVISFFVTVALMLLFALVSGDGLIGELQFLLLGFFLFFVTLWLLIAWVF